jgi:predicted GNAT family N-acyltransferase
VVIRRAGPDELSQALALRHAVFCGEQGVPEHLERDEHDQTALHLVALDGAGRVVATCRLVPGEAAWRLGRMAVAAAQRGRGVGARLLEAAHREAAAAGAPAMELHAQLTAAPFYARAGYAPEGEEFEEAGIAHVAMRRPLVSPRAARTGGGA